MVVHAIAQVTGIRVLRLDDAAERFSYLVAVGPKIGVFTRGEESHHGHPRDAGALFSAWPVAFFRLGFDKVLQAAVVHFAYVAWHGIANVRFKGLSLNFAAVR